MRKAAARPKAQTSNKRSAKFTIAPLNAHTWIVAYSRALLPGAVLRTKNAALDYVFALAKAASFNRVDIEIGDSASLRAGRPV